MLVTICPCAAESVSAPPLTRAVSCWLLSALFFVAFTGGSALADSASTPAGNPDVTSSDVSRDLEAEFTSLFDAMSGELNARTEEAANRAVARAAEREMTGLASRLDRSAAIRATVTQRIERDLDLATSELRARTLSRAIARKGTRPARDAELVALDATKVPRPLPAAIR